MAKAKFIHELTLSVLRMYKSHLFIVSILLRVTIISVICNIFFRSESDFLAVLALETFCSVVTCRMVWAYSRAGSVINYYRTTSDS